MFILSITCIIFFPVSLVWRCKLPFQAHMLNFVESFPGLLPPTWAFSLCLGERQGPGKELIGQTSLFSMAEMSSRRETS